MKPGRGLHQPCKAFRPSALWHVPLPSLVQCTKMYMKPHPSRHASRAVQVLRAVLRSPRVNELAPDREFWDAPQLLQELRRSSYYSAGDDADASPSAYPPALQVRAAGSSPPDCSFCEIVCCSGNEILMLCAGFAG